MKQLAVEAVGHLYLILKSRRCIIKSRKELVWHPMAYFRSAPKSVPFTVSITPKDRPLIFLRQLVF